MEKSFGEYIDQKRRGRGPGGADILLKDIANAMGVTATYFSDIVKGRRNPPEIAMIEEIAKKLDLNMIEREELLDLAGRARDGVAPDLPGYIMDEDIPHVRIALRKASNKKLGNDFWQNITKQIEEAVNDPNAPADS